jgi:hypothetical protein
MQIFNEKHPAVANILPQQGFCLAGFQTTSPTASPCFARSVFGIYITSLSFNKEVTKKMNPDVPSGSSLLCRSAKRNKRDYI